MTVHRPRAFYKLSPQIDPTLDENYKLSAIDLDTIASARENPAYKALFEPGLFGIPVLRKVGPVSISHQVLLGIINTENPQE